jgi:hypothetical protein
VNVIGHHFQLGRFLFQEFSQAFFDGVYKNPAAILRAPNQVKLERVERAAILCVPGKPSFWHYTTDKQQITKKEAIPPPLKTGGCLGKLIYAVGDAYR